MSASAVERHSISASLAASSDAKSYPVTTATHGFEWGFGRGGRYAAHHHLLFTDVLYAPTGLTVITAQGVRAGGRLFVAGPGTFFDPVQLPNFWFMKFLAQPAGPGASLPDKSTDAAGAQPVDGTQALWLDTGTISFSLYRWGHHDPELLTLRLVDRPPQLQVEAGAVSALITP